jgi:hypothetical protein
MNRQLLPALLAIVVSLAGCATSRDLTPAQSTLADVEAALGAPAERRQVGGETWLYYPQQPYGRKVRVARVGGDGKLIAVGGSDARIDLFQAADGKLVRSMPGHTSTIAALVFHPSGSVLVSAGKDRTIRLWNAANGQMMKSLEGHTAWVQGVAFLDDGTRLASVGADRTVRLWNLTEPPKKK